MQQWFGWKPNQTAKKAKPKRLILFCPFYIYISPAYAYIACFTIGDFCLFFSFQCSNSLYITIDDSQHVEQEKNDRSKMQFIGGHISINSENAKENRNSKYWIVCIYFIKWKYSIRIEQKRWRKNGISCASLNDGLFDQMPKNDVEIIRYTCLDGKLVVHSLNIAIL